MEKYELTFPQKNIWLVESFYDSKLVNIVSGSLVIKQAFDILKAEKTVNKFVEINEGMRLRISIDEGIPKQYVSSFALFEADKVNVFGKTEEEIEIIKQEYICRPIDIIDSPLFSYLLIDRGNGVGEIFLKAHHLICDAWSISKMATELSHIYEAILNNEEVEKNNPSYIDFVKAEQAYVNSERYMKDGEFWKNYLQGMTEPVGIKDAIVANDTNAKRYTLKLERDFQQLIDEYCKQNRFSPYVLFLTALAIYIERIKEKTDFAIGTPVLNRANFKEKNMIGMFVSTMPVRFVLDENDTFYDTCKKLVTDSMTLFRHQKYPYTKISEQYKEINGVSDNMYKVMLSYQNARSEIADSKKYEVNWRFSGNIQNELEIHIADLNDSGLLDIHFDYITSLFEDVEIEYIASRLFTIIKDGIVNNSKIEDIKIMPDDEKNKILGVFNDTKRNYPKDRTVIELFEEQVVKNPNKIALVLDNEQLAYSKLNERANCLAEMIIKKGIKENDVVGIIVDKSFELLISIIAVLKIGAYYLPIETNYAHDRKEYLIHDANVKLVIQDNLEKFDVDTIFLSDIEWKNTDFKFIRSTSYGSESPVCILYTSGTTGNPKGAVIINKNIVKLVKNPDYMELKEDDTILQAASTSFDVSLFEFWGTLLNGGTCALIKKSNLLDFEYLNRYMKEKNVTVAWITAALFNQIIDGKIEAFSNLRTVLSGGDVMSLKHVNKLRQIYPELEIINCYGPTECVTFTNTFKVDTVMDKKVPLGKAISNTYGYVIDSKFRLLPLYTEGEYVIGGDSVALKYINKEDLTREKFVEDKITNKGKMYKTGDVVRMLDKGYIDFVGRKDNQVKIRGYRIELDEVKYALHSREGVEDVAVFIYEDKAKSKKIAAFFTAKSEISINEMKAYLKEKLVSYMVPSYIDQLDKLPLNQNGKVNTKELINYINQTESNFRDEKMPEYEGVSKVFYEIFKDILNKDIIYPDDNFFEIGGDSLAAIKVISEAMNHDINITFSDIYKYPSISDLTNMLVKNEAKVSISENLKDIDFTDINNILNKNTLDENEKIETQKLGNVLLTGATGFLGAHILSYLLDNTDIKVYCLVRRVRGKEPENRLKECLQFFFENKYDDFFGTRIITVEGDIVLENLASNVDDFEKLKLDISTVINSAAYVKHYGQLELFKRINYYSVKNIANFAMENNKRLIHISTLSVSGNILEVGQIEQVDIKKGTIFSENKLYIGQNLDNVYAYTKFLGEKVVYEYILKGLDAKVIRMGNLTSRIIDGKFQPNVEENAFVNRLKTIIDLGVVPNNILDFNVEFTPIDVAAKAICLLATTSSKYNTYHLFNQNHIVMSKLDKILAKLGYKLKHITKKQMTELIEFYSNQEDGYEMVKGIIQDLNKNKELDYTPNTVIKSDFTISVLERLGFRWPKIDEKYIEKYIDYLEKIHFLRGDNK